MSGIVVSAWFDLNIINPDVTFIQQLPSFPDQWQQHIRVTVHLTSVTVVEAVLSDGIQP